MRGLDTIKNVPLAIVTIYCYLLFTGCGDDEVIPARLLKTIPPARAIERFTPEMELVFDKPVLQVEVSGVDAQSNGPIPAAIWTLDLSHFEQVHPIVHQTNIPPERVCLTVSYTDEGGRHHEALDCAQLLSIIVYSPPLEIIAATVIDGEVEVDAGFLNANGILLEFNTPVIGEMAIFSGRVEDWNPEASLDWNVERQGTWMRLRCPPNGKKLLNGTVYTIHFHVMNGHGESTTEEITFTTKA